MAAQQLIVEQEKNGVRVKIWKRTVHQHIMQRRIVRRPQYDIYRNALYSHRYEPPPNITHPELPKQELTKGQKTKRVFWRIFKRLLPYILLIMYSFLGGLLFYKLEGDNAVSGRNEAIKRAKMIQNAMINDIVNLVPNSNLSTDDVAEKLQEYAEKLGLQPKDVTEWTFWGSLFFSCTVYTTIGYGNMTPMTKWGQVATMIYALGGIPLVLYALADLGKVFCLSLWKAYTTIMKFIETHRPGSSDNECFIGEFPFSVAILISVGWIMLCSYIFCQWEDWDYFESFYFLFQSLTTIGFGDITPRRPKFMVYSFVVIIIGLAMVSMCWNLIQIKMELLASKIQENIQESLSIEGEEEENEEEKKNDKDPLVKAEDEVEKIAGTENSWLVNLMGESRKRNLVREYDRHARKRNKRTQTDIKYNNQSVSAIPTMCDAVIQTPAVVVGSWVPIYTCPAVDPRPYTSLATPIRHTSSDDFRNKLHELGYLLSDCQEIVRNEQQPLEENAFIPNNEPNTAR